MRCDFGPGPRGRLHRTHESAGVRAAVGSKLTECAGCGALDEVEIAGYWGQVGVLYR